LSDVKRKKDIPIHIYPVAAGKTDTWKARIGMIDLASGLTGEEQMHAILPSDVLLLTSRVANRNEISLESLAEMQGDIQRTVTTIVPEESVDVMIYCCTSGTIAMGEQRLTDLIQEVRPSVPVTNPFSAAVAAFAALGVQRIAMLAPYSMEVTAAIYRAFVGKGVEIPHATTYGLELDSEICQVAEETIMQSALNQDISGVDALFISCTGLRVVDLIEDMENRLGIPVITSNQAMAWHALTLCGYPDDVPCFGRLMRTLAER